MRATLIGRPAQRIKTIYRLIDSLSLSDRHYALVERSRVGQCSDTCFIVVVSKSPIMLAGLSLRELFAWGSRDGGFKHKAKSAETWFSVQADAEAAFQLVVNRKMSPPPEARAKRRRRRA